MSFTILVFFTCTLFFYTRGLHSYEYPEEELNIAPSKAYTPSISPSISPSYDSSSISPPPDNTNPLAPAFFVIGDSSVDSGNNNFLGTFARANHLPYGRDFDSHQPTGRFSNGRIPVDYLGLFHYSLSFLFLSLEFHFSCLAFQDYDDLA